MNEVPCTKQYSKFSTQCRYTELFSDRCFQSLIPQYKIQLQQHTQALSRYQIKEVSDCCAASWPVRSRPAQNILCRTVTRTLRVSFVRPSTWYLGGTPWRIDFLCCHSKYIYIYIYKMLSVKKIKLFSYTPSRRMVQWMYNSTHINVGITWKWVFTFTPRPLNPQ